MSAGRSRIFTFPGATEKRTRIRGGAKEILEPGYAVLLLSPRGGRMEEKRGSNKDRQSAQVIDRPSFQLWPKGRKGGEKKKKGKGRRESGRL